MGAYNWAVVSATCPVCERAAIVVRRPTTLRLRTTATKQAGSLTAAISSAQRWHGGSQGIHGMRIGRKAETPLGAHWFGKPATLRVRFAPLSCAP
jgi:hypothetical protein